MKRLPAPALALLALSACATVPPHPDNSLDAFAAALAAQDSATAALTDWCAQHHIATPATITARPAGGAALAPGDRLRATLEIGPDEALGYRHVLLSCGGVALSEAHNWYVPARLTAETNRLLDTTDTPFGRAVGPANFTRIRIADERGAIEECPPDSVLSHVAILRLADGRPISLVVECYTPANLGH